MAKKSKDELVECIAYLSVDADLRKVTRLEDKQLRYIREYAKANQVKIVDIVRRNGFGKRDMNRQLERIISLIKKKRVQGVILSNVNTVCNDVEEIYALVGRFKAVGGIFVTVDQGRMGMNIKGVV